MLFSKITILSLFLFLLPCAFATRELSWSALFAPIDGFERTLGGRKDHDVFLPLERCYGKQDICPAGFPRGERNKNSVWYKQPCCTALINCMLDELSGAASADMQAGSTIVALIPTILLLFGFSSVDIIKLAVSEPLHAILACFFGTALPRGIFRRFNRAPDESDKPEIVWKIQIPRYPWPIRTVLNMIGLFVLGGPMIWLVYNICSQSMIVWKCDRALMVAYWPIACLAWLPIAMLYLFCISSITIVSHDNKRQNWLSLILLRQQNNEHIGDSEWSYYSIISSKISTMFRLKRTTQQSTAPMSERRRSTPCPHISPFLFQEDISYPPPSRSNTGSSCEEGGFTRFIPISTSSYPSDLEHSDPARPIRALSHRSNTDTSCSTTTPLFHPPPPAHTSSFASTTSSERRQHAEEAKYFKVTIRIKSKAHWIWFQTFIESMAVAIYLYATIVLSSIMFLKATEAIIYSSVLCSGQFFIRLYISYFDNSLDEEDKKFE